MNSMKKRIALVMTAVALAATAITGCSSNKTIDSSAVVATINDEEVTLGTANLYARYQQAMFETQYGAYLGEGLWSTPANDKQTMEQSTKDSIMESIKQLYVLEDHMDEYQVSITDEETAKIEEAAKKFVEANQDAKVKEVITADEETAKEVLTLLTIQNKMRSMITKDVDMNVSDEEAAQKTMDYVFFSTSKTDESGQSKDMTKEEKEAVKEEAQKYLDGAKDAKDLKAYTEEAGYSLSTKAFDSKDVDPAKELIEAADGLKAGEFTDIIETKAGYYVAKLTSVFDTEATEMEKANIIQKRKDAKYTEVIDKFINDAKITVNEKEWDKISFSKQSVKIKQEIPQGAGEPKEDN